MPTARSRRSKRSSLKPIAGGGTLTCNLPPHTGPHGMAEPGLPPYVRWGEGIAWSAKDEGERAARFGWRKGHVRRAYQTLAMWKAGR